MSTGFTIRAYSSTHRTFSKNRYYCSEGKVWLAYFLGTPSSAQGGFSIVNRGKAAYSFTMFQKELVEAIDGEFSKLEKTLISRAKIFTSRMSILVLVNPTAQAGTQAANRSGAFIARFTGGSSGGASGMRNLVNGMVEYDLGNKVSLAILFILLRFHQHSYDGKTRSKGILTIALDDIG